MREVTQRQKQALDLVNQLIKLDPDEGTLFLARKLKARLELPMTVVLEALWPDLSVAEKVERLGVTRQAYYGWLAGTFRPDTKMSKTLARHTGLDANEIRGQHYRRRR